MGEAEKAGTGIPYTPLFTPIALHILIFKASQRNWKDYTRYLSQQLSNLVRLILYCFRFPTRHEDTETF